MFSCWISALEWKFGNKSKQSWSISIFHHQLEAKFGTFWSSFQSHLSFWVHFYLKCDTILISSEWIRALNDALFIGSIIDGLITLTFNSEVLSRIVIAFTCMESEAIIVMIIIENFIFHSFSLSASTFVGFKNDSSNHFMNCI